MAITIIIADDHPVVRMGLRLLLEREPGLAIVGEAATGPETVQLVRRLAPRVVILDLMMPGMNGMEVLDELRLLDPRPRIIILSMHSDRSYVSEAIRRGANSYVVKDSLVGQIVRAIHAVAADRDFFPTPQAETRAARNAAPGSGDPFDSLTNREKEILAHVAQGRANKEIADQLAISVRTVETHRARIMRKLDLQSHAALIHYATQKKLLIGAPVAAP